MKKISFQDRVEKYWKDIIISENMSLNLGLQNYQAQHFFLEEENSPLVISKYKQIDNFYLNQNDKFFPIESIFQFYGISSKNVEMSKLIIALDASSEIQRERLFFQKISELGKIDLLPFNFQKYEIIDMAQKKLFFEIEPYLNSIESIVA